MRVKYNEPMRNHTTWRIGGPVDTLLQPENIVELQQTFEALQRAEEPFYVIGGGSNILVADEGLLGTVIKLGGSLLNLEIKTNKIKAEAGVPLPLLAQKAAGAGLSGLEFAVGIPGTVGGAVVMNAGAYGSQISDVVQEVLCCDRKGMLHKFTNEECKFLYRNSRFKNQQELFILEILLSLQTESKEVIKQRISENNQRRVEKQPTNYPSAGSVFQNPPGDAAGRLIEKIGAKGWRVGDAMVSEKHCNFIVNLGQASCRDVLTLIEKIKRAVKNDCQIELKQEILYLGAEKGANGL